MAFKRIASQIQQFFLCVCDLIKKLNLFNSEWRAFDRCLFADWLNWLVIRICFFRAFDLKGLWLHLWLLWLLGEVGKGCVFLFGVLKLSICLKRHLLKCVKKFKTLVKYSNYRGKWKKLYCSCVAIRSRNLSLISLERFTVENCLSSNVLCRRACFKNMLET
jgi:hypothetical protein